MNSLRGLTALLLPPTHSPGDTRDEETSADVDEPPDHSGEFAKLPQSQSIASPDESTRSVSPHSRKSSLLTQALLSSPEIAPLSDIETPHLTSDGGMTSPTRTTTPSPPMPPLAMPSMPQTSPIELVEGANSISQVGVSTSCADRDMARATDVEETLGRRRCISFACGPKDTASKAQKPNVKPSGVQQEALGGSRVPIKRPCVLRFACLTKPPRSEAQQHQRTYKNGLSQTRSAILTPVPCAERTERTDPRAPAFEAEAVPANPESSLLIHKPQPPASPISSAKPSSLKPFNRVNFQKSEATSFHEFASLFRIEDEWTNEQTAYRQRLTIDDTLQKENAIRRLAEDAEEDDDDSEMGSIQEDDDNSIEESDDPDTEVNRPDNQISHSPEGFDDGNESDDEEGFADSDEESEIGSSYHFWTPGLTTAATSTEQVESIRPVLHRRSSESSLQSFDLLEKPVSRSFATKSTGHGKARPQKNTSEHGRAPSKSDDFIIGTLDEDRPSEDAYFSTLEQRRSFYKKIIPQDIDPSFPTSDPENEDDGNDSDDEECVNDDLDGAKVEHENGHSFIKSHKSPRCSQSPTHGKSETASAQSPKRLRSPAPRRLFGQSSHRLRSPPPPHRRLASPPSSRRVSPRAVLSPVVPQNADVNHLAQRPHLTHTASLPRTPNPFWAQHRIGQGKVLETSLSGVEFNHLRASSSDVHTRGPIDIVQGLESKKQRRKEKYWRIHCQRAHAGKERERRCQPGKGAERMREVGMEMQDRFRGYGRRAQLVLSI